MTNQEIITKAIQKAIEGGYNIGSPEWEVRGNGVYFIGDVTEIREDFATVIFNHDFAKALWPGDSKVISITLDESTKETIGVPVPAWQYHLQNMVIAEDPVKYLGGHLND